MASLLVFNPEHDLALAVGQGPYTPPSEISKLKKNLSLLPALYADNSDFILIDSHLEGSDTLSLIYYDLALTKNLKLVRIEELERFSPTISKVIPWGWDHAIRQSLLLYGVSERLLPSRFQIDNIRRLSHRNMTILFRKRICEILNLPLLNPTKELFNINEVESYLNSNPLAYFKAPWSSSGRGIVVSDHITQKGLLEWAHGVIRRQGSVMAEPKWNRNIDFASEWYIENGEPEFIGYSVFQTSDRGKYHGNIKGSQEDMKGLILQKTSFNSKIIEAQKRTLQELIAPYYSGPLGIDMLADDCGNINHCVEINLRLTMGFIEIEKGIDKLKKL